MAQVFGTLCCFSSKPFLKQLASHVSAAMLQLKFPGMKFFSSILGIETFLFGWLKSFFHSVNDRQVVTHKKIEKHDGENVFP